MISREEQQSIQLRRNEKFILKADIRTTPYSELNDFQKTQLKNIYRQYIINLQKYIPFGDEYHLYTLFNKALQFYGFDKVAEILEE
jgi:hypothetical protein